MLSWLTNTGFRSFRLFVTPWHAPHNGIAYFDRYGSESATSTTWVFSDTQIITQFIA